MIPEPAIEPDESLPLQPPAEGLPPEFQRLAARVRPEQRMLAMFSLAALPPLGIRSFEQLASTLPSLHDPALGSALHALPFFDRRRSVPLLLERLRSSEAAVRCQAIVVLEMTEAMRAVRAIIHHLRHDPDPHVREQSAHALGFPFNSRFDALIFEPLLAALDDQEEAPAVRAQAAESLGNLVGYADRRTRRYRRAQASLLRALDHPAPEIRFWAVFALGTMGSRTALPKLRQLAEADTALCPGWWAVNEEASDAIQSIVTGSWPQHDRSRVAG